MKIIAKRLFIAATIPPVAALLTIKAVIEALTTTSTSIEAESWFWWREL